MPHEIFSTISSSCMSICESTSERTSTRRSQRPWSSLSLSLSLTHQKLVGRSDAYDAPNVPGRLSAHQGGTRQWRIVDRSRLSAWPFETRGDLIPETTWSHSPRLCLVVVFLKALIPTQPVSVRFPPPKRKLPSRLSASSRALVSVIG